MNTINFTERFSARITPDEKKFIEILKAEMDTTDSEIFRKLIHMYKNKTEAFESKEYLFQRRELIKEINKIGVNINQIAARVNTGVYLKSDKLALLAYMQQIKELLNQAIK